MKLTIKDFEKTGLNKVAQVLYSKKCFMCPTVFDDVLYNHKWNSEYLFHLKSTHGIDPQTLIAMFRKIMEEVNEKP